MSDVNIFEQASMLGLRYATPNGTLSTEDLWYLDLEILNAVAMGYQKEIKETGEVESFLTKASAVSEQTKLGLEICKRIIEVRLEKLDTAKKASAKKMRNQRIMEIMAEKQDGALQEKSMEELQAMLDED